MTRIAALLGIGLILAVAVNGQPALAGAITAARAERVEPGKVAVSWTDSDPVDVYASTRPDAPIALGALVAGGDRDGRFEMTVPAGVRPYFVLRDRAGGTPVRVAERLMPLEQGSNFRDIGGYPAAGGKHIRWGLIYRSGATAMLTDADIRFVQGLGLKDMVDLRSSEERSLAPTRVEGVRYSAVGYPMMKILDQTTGGYRSYPEQFIPQLRILFGELLAGEGPVAYNCSAGQDRTGFATAMIMSALGVPREVIMSDYHLSTADRRPEYEMPHLDPAAHPNDPVAAFFIRFQQDTPTRKPRPLFDAQHRSFLDAAFDEIDARWGSVDNYLQKALGVGPAERRRLRAMYLE